MGLGHGAADSNIVQFSRFYAHLLDQRLHHPSDQVIGAGLAQGAAVSPSDGGANCPDDRHFSHLVPPFFSSFAEVQLQSIQKSGSRFADPPLKLEPVGFRTASSAKIGVADILVRLELGNRALPDDPARLQQI